LRPAGRQIPVGDFPVNIALHPAGQFAAVSHCGYGQHEIVVINTARRTSASAGELARKLLRIGLFGDGLMLNCSGASGEVIHRVAFANGYLTGRRNSTLRDPRLEGISAGLCP